MKTLSTRTSLTRLLWAIAALVMALIAQRYLASGGNLTAIPPFAASPADGLVVWGVAALLMLLALRSTLSGDASPGYCSPGSMAHQQAVSIWRWIGICAWFVLAGLITIAALRLFATDTPGALAWVLYLGAAPVFLVAVYAMTPFERDGWRLQAGRVEWALFILILLVAAFFRFYRFGELPYGLWYDEADNGLWARQILSDPSFRPIYVPSTNLPSHFLFLIALAFRLLGDSMWSIRAVAAMMGMLTAVAAYFCGRELFGWQRAGRWLGLILAGWLAVSRWDVNWSRIGMHGVSVPLFELWTMAALLRGLRTGRLTSFAWAGLSLGYGLCFYSPMRVFPVIVVGFGLVWLFKWLRAGNRSLRQAISVWSLPLVVFVIAGLIAVAPVAQFALRHPQVFFDRAAKISLFIDPQARAHPLQALTQNTVRHLLMFNYRGDPNGRHNWPGLPMLDRISGALFGLGLVVCLWRWREPRATLLALWLLVPLSGGIMSVAFEAPQSLRCIGALPAAYILACLPLEWFANEWRRVFSPARLSRLGWVAGALVSAAALLEGVTYFHIWGHDFAAWAAFNPAETHMAQDINQYRDTFDLRFDPLLTAHLATRYLAPDYPVYHHFDPATVFPLRGSDKAGTLLFIAPDSSIVREQAHQLYPGVRVELFTHPESGHGVMFRYIFSREAIAAAQGLDAVYVSADQTMSLVNPLIDFNWTAQQPASLPFQVEWNGGLLSPDYGAYTLMVETSGEISLDLDGQPVLSGSGTQRRQIVMAQGVHALRLSCRLEQPGAIRLLWQPPTGSALSVIPTDALYRAAWPINGLLGRFYANANWEGEPQIVRLDRQPAYYFHFLPLPRPYTVEWSGRLLAPMDGVYRLGLRAISTASLWIDGQPLLQNTAAGQYQDADIRLKAGLHDIQLRFLDNQDRSQIYLYWQTPDQPFTRLVPSDALFYPAEGAWW